MAWSKKKLARKEASWKSQGITNADGSFFTKQDYRMLFTGQWVSCGTKRPKGKGWVVDHDHRTGIARYVLCPQCNVGIGMFKDSPAVLRNMADLLVQHNNKGVVPLWQRAIPYVGIGVGIIVVSVLWQRKKDVQHWLGTWELPKLPTLPSLPALPWRNKEEDTDKS